MTKQDQLGLNTFLSLISGAASIERIFDGNLSSIKGISLAEFRLLSAINNAPAQRASRADIARVVGLSPSAVTRALRPLESLGVVQTVKNERDARLALASLTPAGEELLSDANGVLEDVVPQILERVPSLDASNSELPNLLAEINNL